MTFGLEAWASGFIHQYGYTALFVLMLLETAMILHFVPSEAIVPVGAAFLATDPASLGMVILVTTAGATLGAVALYVFARTGGRRFLLSHPRIFHVTPERQVRLERAFQRPAGEASVFVFRLVPVMRAVISVPAGLARMNATRFTLYSAAGCAVFDAVLAYGTYAARRNAALLQIYADLHEYWTTHVPLAIVLFALVGIAAFLAWRRRHQYLREPHVVVSHAWQAGAVFVTGIGAGLLIAAVAFPGPTFELVTWIQDDVQRAVDDVGLSPLAFLAMAAIALLALGLIALSLAPLLERWAKRLIPPRDR